MHKLVMRGERGTGTLTVHRLGLNSPVDGGSRPNGQGNRRKARVCAASRAHGALSCSLSVPVSFSVFGSLALSPRSL